MADSRWSKCTLADEFGTILSVCLPNFPVALEQALVELLDEIGFVMVLSANPFDSATKATATAASSISMWALDADDQSTLTQAVGILLHVCELECGRRCTAAESRRTRRLGVAALADEALLLTKPVAPHRWRYRYASGREPPSKLEIAHAVRPALRQSGAPSPDLKWSEFLNSSKTDAFSASGAGAAGPSSDASSDDATPADLEVALLQTANSRRRLHILGWSPCHSGARDVGERCQPRSVRLGVRHC
jgi:hypothetical protein